MFVIVSSSDKSLGGEQSVFRVGHSLRNVIKKKKTYLSLSGNTTEPLVVVGEGNDRGGGPLTCKSMMDGLPSAFSITLALLPSMTATQELVVPRSIPMMLHVSELLNLRELSLGS